MSDSLTLRGHVEGLAYRAVARKGGDPPGYMGSLVSLDSSCCPDILIQSYTDGKLSRSASELPRALGQRLNVHTAGAPFTLAEIGSVSGCPNDFFHIGFSVRVDYTRYESQG